MPTFLELAEEDESSLANVHWETGNAAVVELVVVGIYAVTISVSTVTPVVTTIGISMVAVVKAVICRSNGHKSQKYRNDSLHDSCKVSAFFGDVGRVVGKVWGIHRSVIAYMVQSQARWCQLWHPHPGTVPRSEGELFGNDGRETTRTQVDTGGQGPGMCPRDPGEPGQGILGRGRFRDNPAGLCEGRMVVR